LFESCRQDAQKSRALFRAAAFMPLATIKLINKRIDRGSLFSGSNRIVLKGTQSVGAQSPRPG
jgi:hypothetical protein